MEELETPRQANCVSVVIPLFNEQEVLPRLLERLVAVADLEDTYAWQFLLVDDGSHDETLPLLREAAAGDERIQVIALSRNFGHQAAITAGLDFSQGDAVAVIAYW